MRETLKTTNVYAKLVVALLVLVWLVALVAVYGERETVAQAVEAIRPWWPL